MHRNESIQFTVRDVRAAGANPLSQGPILAQHRLITSHRNALCYHGHLVHGGFIQLSYVYMVRSTTQQYPVTLQHANDQPQQPVSTLGRGIVLLSPTYCAPSCTRTLLSHSSAGELSLAAHDMTSVTPFLALSKFP